MFIDEAIIKLKAGDGGNGCHAYERAIYKPKGRPDGGDGGRGGHIYVIGSSQLHTLQDSAFRQHYHAERGMHGKGSNKTGKNGQDITIAVPLGTVLIDEDSKDIIADCIDEKKSIIAARGGRGGRGNASLVTSRNRNPEAAEAGKPGEEKKVRMVLKVLADVGLVGRPNAGKSTFLSRVSRARPKIADYPFTTTKPHLGIVAYGKDHGSFVMADIPGLIEDSHKGKGLGIRFLRHIERTRVLAYLIDCTVPDPLEEAMVLQNELRHYSEDLAAKPSCFILTKTDLTATEEQKAIPDGWLSMSAVTGSGIETVVMKLASLVRDAA